MPEDLATWRLSPSRTPAVSRRGMVATSSPQAALAGLAALERGGNACDAALAAAGMLAVCEPNQCGPGGDLFAIVLEDGRPPAGLNASGRSPAEPGDLLPQEFGPTSVTVPGCVAGWYDLADRYSRLGLEAALAPAVAAAESGVVIAPRAAALWREEHAHLEGAAAVHFELHDPFANPEIARALRAARDGTFYRGPIAEAIASVCWLSAADLEAHRNDWVEPIPFRFGDHTLLELPPNGQGSIAGWALEALAEDLRPAAQVEALADAYARGYAGIGGTAYACAADADGMAVSLIQSVFYGFGSRLLVPGYGFALQNRGSGFVVQPGHPNDFAPGKRPFHTIIPAALVDDKGKWSAVLGVTGGQFQPQGHVQVLVNMLGHGMDPQAALDAPRYRLEEDGSVSLEPPLAALAGEFGDRTTRVIDDPDNFGNGHLITRRRDGLLVGGSEPRRDGAALGL
jgi:gamma-glutamyltranspeptidase / glutathione hydrolase